MTTLATDIQDQNFTLPVSWDGNRHSGTVPTFTPPSGLAASESTGTITLTWTNGTASAETIVERSLTGSGGWTTIATKTAATTTHDDAPGGSGTFYYRVSHTLNSYQSAYSSTVSETISYVPPVADGDEKTVTITGAGSNIAASQQSFLGGSTGVVEGATVGAQFTTFRPANWSQPGAHGPKCSNTIVLNGTKSLLNDTVGGNYQFGMRYDCGATRAVQFTRCSYYLDNPDNVVGQLKFIRSVGDIATYGGIHDANQPNHYITYFNPAAGGGGYYMPINNSTLGGTNTTRSATSSSGIYYSEGVWITLEYTSTYNTDVSASDGEVVLVARDEETGAILGSYTWSGIRLDYGGADRHRWILHQFYMGNGLANGNTKCYIDRDVYVSYSTTTTKPKFILLGNASTYAACTKFTICEYTAWVDNGATSDITFRVNQGYHASLSGIYVYAMSGPNTPINSTGVALS